MDIYVIAVTNWLRGKARISTSRPTGVIIAPPNPCSTRVATSSGKLSEKPHSAEAAVKISKADANTRRGPNRSAIQPLSGMNTARLRI